MQVGCHHKSKVDCRLGCGKGRRSQMRQRSTWRLYRWTAMWCLTMTAARCQMTVAARCQAVITAACHQAKAVAGRVDQMVMVWRQMPVILRCRMATEWPQMIATARLTAQTMSLELGCFGLLGRSLLFLVEPTWAEGRHFRKILLTGPPLRQ